MNAKLTENIKPHVITLQQKWLIHSHVCSSRKKKQLWFDLQKIGEWFWHDIRVIGLKIQDKLNDSLRGDKCSVESKKWWVCGGGGRRGAGVWSGSLVSWHRYQRLLRHPRHLYVLFDQDKKWTITVMGTVQEAWNPRKRPRPRLLLSPGSLSDKVRKTISVVL